MQLQESKNLDRVSMVAPPTFGRSIIARPLHGISACDLLGRVVEVWKSVAQWGTWHDEELGEWPSDANCIASLPEWFRDELQEQPRFSIDAWLSDLHDREWMWWNGLVVSGCIKVDLDSQSMPISTWMLEAVIESAGGKVIYRDKWISAHDATRFLSNADV